MKNIIKIVLLLCIASMAFAVYGQNSCTTDEGVVINGIRWATRNVDKPGTFTEKPEDAGMFYQWNRKVGWNSTDPLVNSDGGTTWNTNEAAGESWRKENDPCPCGWRVPTKGEQQSLVDAGGYWGELNDISGYFFGNGKNSLFLPASGSRGYSNGALDVVGTVGYYWSSNAYYASHAYSLNVYRIVVTVNSNRGKSFGVSIRCIAE
ncbi:MAG: fibrobacter succinogenes major paralogous domain-containing protein [Bacteroidales bacterium]|nr:fibrobacter succinogenes major paralogous domain-containing protein [Bacteroidales bacterium]